jgi:hypothetical protein
MKTFFVFFALIFGVCAQELEACGVCTTVVQTLEGFLNQYATKQELMKELAAISAQVCEHVPDTIATKEQCQSYVSLYGPYTIDLLLSKENPESICSTMGMCTRSNTHYKLVFPIISDYSINYAFTEENIVADSIFNYKMFLADPSFLDDNDYELTVQVNKISGCDITLKITNKTTFVQTETCKQDSSCNLSIRNPGRGVWYYVTITTKLHAPKSSFSFNAIERNATKEGRWILKEERHHFSPARFGLILCLSFSCVCLICICISRCAHRRKMIKRRNFQQQTEPIFIEVVPEMVVSIEEETRSMVDPRSMMYPHNMPMIFPFAPNQNYIQMQQLPH